MNPDVISAIKVWLSSNIPEWKHFKILSVSKYLGFQLGPDAGRAQWTGTFKKFKDRVDEIKRSGAPVSVAAFTYNIKVIPVPLYIIRSPDM